MYSLKSRPYGKGLALLSRSNLNRCVFYIVLVGIGRKERKRKLNLRKMRRIGPSASGMADRKNHMQNGLMGNDYGLCVLIGGLSTNYRGYPH
jgi:hypothetical protein